MIGKNASSELASREVQKFIRPLNPGDLAYIATLNDEKGRSISFDSDYLSGQPLILIFLPSLENEAAIKELKRYQEILTEFNSKKFHILLITAESDAQKNYSLRQKLALPWPVLIDPGGATFAAYGLSKETVTFRTVLLSPFRQVQAVLTTPEKKRHAEKVLDLLGQTLTFQESPWAPPHPPVLVIPGVLTGVECRDLIKLFETQGELKVSLPRGNEATRDYKIPVYDYDRQDRIDHIINNAQVNTFLEGRMVSRVYPMIKKAFAFEINRHEPFHIARYVGSRKGTKVGHRDNTDPKTSYRRFALSINLNDDYEGGHLVFREFSEQGYRGRPGTTFIFSSSLLHEILETTSGTRYNLISHLFNDRAIGRA